MYTNEDKPHNLEVKQAIELANRRPLDRGYATLRHNDLPVLVARIYINCLRTRWDFNQCFDTLDGFEAIALVERVATHIQLEPIEESINSFLNDPVVVNTVEKVAPETKKEIILVLKLVGESFN